MDEMSYKLLKILRKSEGNHIATAGLTEILGVSRTTVLKHLNLLREQGYEIETHPISGHRLIFAPDALIESEILWNLTTKTFGRKLYCYNSTNSTNDLAMKLADAGAPEGTLVVAEEQTGGRGRLSRSWFSPPKLGIWASLVLRPSIVPAQVPRATMCIAISIARALRRSTGVRTLLKWPNDVLINGKKVCGILTEMNAEIDKVNYVVVGFGINVNHTYLDFPDKIRDQATSLKIETGQGFNRPALLRSILDMIEQKYHYITVDPSVIVDEWKGLCAHINKEVEVRSGDSVTVGVTQGITQDGALLIESATTRQVILSGDVSLSEK